MSLPGLVQTEGWGLEPAPSDYLCGPRMEDSDAFDARGRSYAGRQCLLSLFTGHADVYDILLTTQGKKKEKVQKHVRFILVRGVLGGNYEEGGEVPLKSNSLKKTEQGISPTRLVYSNYAELDAQLSQKKLKG